MANWDDIAPSFSFAVNMGLVPSKVIYDPQAFGNANFLMNGTAFSLRFDRDRGQLFVDIGSDTSRWYKLEYVLEFLDGSITQGQLGEPPDITVLADLLNRFWDKVTRLFNDQKQMEQLRVFTEQKTACFLGNFFGTP